MNRVTPESVPPLVGNTVDAASVQGRRLSHFVVDAAINAQESVAQGAKESLGNYGQAAMIGLNGLRMRMLSAKAERAERKMEHHEFKTAARADATKRYLGRQDEDPASMKALLNNHGRGVLSNHNPYRPTSTRERVKLQKLERKQRLILAEQGMNLFTLEHRGRQGRDYHSNKTRIMSDRPQSAHEIEHGYDQLIAQFDDPQDTTREHNLSRSERRALHREKDKSVEIFEESHHFAEMLRHEAEKAEPDSPRYTRLKKRKDRLLRRANKHETKRERRQVSKEQNVIYAQLMNEQRRYDRGQRKDRRSVAHEQSSIYADYLRDQRTHRHDQHKESVKARHQVRRDNRAQQKQEKAARKNASKPDQDSN